MMIRLKLFDIDKSAPDWWMRLLANNHLEWVEVGEINSYVSKEFNARFTTTIAYSPWGTRYLEFDDEKDYLLFLLRIPY